MKRLFVFAFVASMAMAVGASAQDKSQRPSPPAKVSQTLASGATVSIDYSQPSVKGRPFETLAPAGRVWRTGANEATVFETSKNVTVEGKALPAGKYSLYTIPGASEWTVIFNKTWQQWGTVYKASEDALRVTVKPGKSPAFTEKMTFAIDKSGKTSLNWADVQVDFKVQ